MKKHYSPLLLTCAFTFASVTCHAANSTSSPTSPAQTATSPQTLDQQIETLEKQLATLRRNMLNSEIHAQTYMIDNWHEFAEDINRTEDNEKVILALKKKIQDLKDQKNLQIKDRVPTSK